MHIGIFGGTFNPVHYGHLFVADMARDAFSMDRVLFVPSSLPPHKNTVPVANAEDRLKMVGIAIEDNPDYDVLDVEIKRKGRSYSIETLRYLKDRYGTQTDISFILGWDSFKDIVTWKDYKELFTLSNFVVVSRSGHNEMSIHECLPVEVSRDFCYDDKKKLYMHTSNHFIVYLDTPLIEISSTMIRERLAQGRTVRYFMPRGVGEYITRHSIY